MKQLIWVGLMMVLLTACTRFEFDGCDPTTATVRWLLKTNELNRTSVHVTPRASLCTATVDPRNKMRLGVEPLPPCEYVHGKHGG